MTSLVGHHTQVHALLTAMRAGTLHHAWLLAGSEGVGKATFAAAAAARMLAEAIGRQDLGATLELPQGHPTSALLASGAHPDFRTLRRLPKDAAKPDGEIARNITVDQVRSLGPLFATSPSLSPRRVVVIDAIDDLERPAANALLKNLEEPPAGTIFLLVSHAPGRLLPTIRSRCRLLRFAALEDADMRRVLHDALPEASDAEFDALVRAGGGSPGRALRYVGLELATIEATLDSIAQTGDPDNAGRVRLAKALGSKAAQPRYEAFLDRVPSIVADAARGRTGAPLIRALDAHRDAMTLANAARTLSPDAYGQAVFELAGVVARLAERRTMR